MSNSLFLNRVILRNYKSIGYCDVALRPLTYLVGSNGAGKSNFLDALHFVKDSLEATLDSALNERGGLADVRRRSSGHPTHFGVRLEFTLKTGKQGHYAFSIAALPSRGYEVQTEECIVGGTFFRVERGQFKASSESPLPAVTADRLALVALSGLPAFRGVFDALTAMGFYNLNPKLIRDLQRPQDGRLLRSVGENISSVIGHLERVAPEQIAVIEGYLKTIVPTVHGLERKSVGPMETLEFRQDMAGAKHPWRFLAQNMSDGTLRALGVLSALFQGNKDYTPSVVGIEEPETALHPAAAAALREALSKASEHTQVLVTSHSPDLLDDPELDASSLVAVISEEGETRLAPLDEASRDSMKRHLFTAGELLRINQLAPDRNLLAAQQQRQLDLFGRS